MKFLSPLIAVSNIEQSKAFYKKHLGLDAVRRFSESGMTMPDIVRRMDVQEKYVLDWMGSGE